MATTLLTSPVSVLLNWNFVNVLNTGNSSQPGAMSFSGALVDGTGAGAANKIYPNQLTISPSATTSIDLRTFVDAVYGGTIDMSKVKLMWFHLLSATEGGTACSGITVGGNANAFSDWLGAANDKIKVANGGCFLLSCPDANGYAVTANTGDVLDITNDDASLSAKVNILVIGE